MEARGYSSYASKLVRAFARRLSNKYKKWHRLDIHITNYFRAIKDKEMLDEVRKATNSITKKDIYFSGNDWPLVSVRIPTYNRADILVNRSIGSVLKQTYQNFEIVIVGDCCTDHTREAVKSIGDVRIRFHNLDKRGEYPVDARKRWYVAGVTPVNYALHLCRGEWMAPLDDDDEFTEDHIEVLLQTCLERNLEFAYGIMEMEDWSGQWENLGSWPLRVDNICHGSVFYYSSLRFFKYDINAWKIGEPADWNLWHRMKRAGVKMGFVNQVVGRHYMEGTNPGLQY